VILPIAAALASSCTHPEELGLAVFAITEGADDPDDPAVIAIRVRGEVVCTGTAIAPRVVLTAAHCIAGVALADLAVGLGAAADGEQIAVTHTRPHPRYHSSFLTDDVGLVLLAEPAIAAAAAPPRLRAPLGESALGGPVRVVGYGRTEPEGSNAPRKHEGVAALEEIRVRELVVGPGPSLPCTGDSGGPAFVTIDGVELLAGVASHGDPACARTAAYGRVDVHEDSFITPYLTATGVGSAAMGERCYDDTTCEEGHCLAVADPVVRTCATECATGADCPAGTRCETTTEGRWCTRDGPVPGVLGAACDQDAACEQGLCAAEVREAQGTCRLRCNVGDACPAGEECQTVADVEVCVPVERSGSCAIGADGDRRPWLGALVLALTVARRRGIREARPRTCSATSSPRGTSRRSWTAP
jgi:hypothetical protein